MKKNQSGEHSLREVLRVLRMDILPIFLAAVVSGLAVLLVTKVFITPVYISETKLYVSVHSDSTGSFTAADQSTRAYSVKDCAEIITSRTVMEDVITELGLGITPRELAGKISVMNPAGTSCIKIDVRDKDPYAAQSAADAISSSAARHISDITDDLTVQTIDSADIPVEPSGPSIFRDAAFGALGGAVLAVLLVILNFVFHNTIKTQNDADRYLQLPVLGVIPSDSEKYAKQTEAFDFLRTNISFCGEDIKTISVMSCSLNEGKAFVSRSLSASMAEAGKRVILIDTDFRKAPLNGFSGDAMNESKGLSHFLSGQAPFAECLSQTEYSNLQIIYSGHSSANPSNLLGGKRFAVLLRELRKKYDYIIINSPPLKSETAALTAAGQSDGIVLVFSSGKTDCRSARMEIAVLENSGCRILGSVINKDKKNPDDNFIYYSDADPAFSEKNDTGNP